MTSFVCVEIFNELLIQDTIRPPTISVLRSFLFSPTRTTICRQRASARRPELWMHRPCWACLYQNIQPSPGCVAFRMKLYLVSTWMRHLQFRFERGNNQVPNSEFRRYFNNIDIFFNIIIVLTTTTRTLQLRVLIKKPGNTAQRGNPVLMRFRVIHAAVVGSSAGLFLPEIPSLFPTAIPSNENLYRENWVLTWRLLGLRDLRPDILY